MKYGDKVLVKPSDSIFDCCAGKRGMVTHQAVGGGWLLVTDHFCPIARRDEDVEIIPFEQLAREELEKHPEDIVKEYEVASTVMLERYADQDKLAAAVLLLRKENSNVL